MNKSSKRSIQKYKNTRRVQQTKQKHKYKKKINKKNKNKNKKSQIENLVLACGRIGMQPVPDHTRNRTRNRSLRFCFRFRFRIWLAVYQFNAHFGARLGFVLCFVFDWSCRRRVAYLARRVRTEDWRLSSSWKLGSAAVADDDDVASAARSARVRFVCPAEGSALRRSCAFRQRRQNVKSTP